MDWDAEDGEDGARLLEELSAREEVWDEVRDSDWLLVSLSGRLTLELSLGWLLSGALSGRLLDGPPLDVLLLSSGLEEEADDGEDDDDGGAADDDDTGAKDS